MENTFHKGIVMEKVDCNVYNVWIPTDNCTVPIVGSWQQLYANTGSALDGETLYNAEMSAKPCIVSSELTSGAWFKAKPELGASVFNNRYRDGDPVYDYRLVTKYIPPFSNPIPPITMSSDMPALTLSACAPTLNIIGGMPVPTTNNIPPGTYVELEKGQHVLVVFPISSSYGIIIASLPSKEEFLTMIG